jgi:hypothetical protein
MLLKRTSPNLLIPLPGTVEFGDKDVQAVTIPHERHKTQIAYHGTCDHKKLAPVFYTPPAHHRKRPDIITQLLKAIQNTYRKSKLLAKLFYRKQKVHSQRREAIIRVLQVMFQYMDLETLEVGFYNEIGDFIRLDITKIASYANVSLIRAKRALGDITAAGYLTTIRQYKKTDDGQKIGVTAIRKISHQLFSDLGIDHFAFFTAQEWKRKRNEKKIAKKNSQKLRSLYNMINSVTDKTTHKTYSAIRKASVLLDQVSKEITAVVKKIERQNE